MRMEQNRTHSPEAATDEPASSSTQAPEAGAPPPLSIPEQLVSQSLNQTFSGAERRDRRCRHDGWTPERQVAFLEALAACGVVMDACKQAGLSAQSAYAFRNRRSGRAFGTAWDAVLIHRARGRLSDELLSRSINGCIEAIHQNGEITGERHRFDNRLSMAVLTRLDRLAEKEGHRAEQLRAVSEDLDDFLDCVESGGDADDFIDSRGPDAERPEPRREEDMDGMASLLGCLHLKSVHPLDIDISNMSEDRTMWPPQDYPRGYYSGYLEWLEQCEEMDRRGKGPKDRSPQAFKRQLRASLLRGGEGAAAVSRHARWKGSEASRPPEGPDSEAAPQPSSSSTSSTCPGPFCKRPG
jgi:hypothetical protein